MTLFDEEQLSHYQTLGVEKTAGNEEIKRAYFSMVRKYQPGTAPEEFKKIRGAYETLIDTQKRAEYDAIGELPHSVAPFFHEAQWFDHLGRHSKAAELYQLILKSHPELDNVREQYAKSLVMDEKTGKAVEVWEELCRRNPSNAPYSEELAECYFDRGWHKKAEAELKRTLALDPSSLDAWSLSLRCIVEKMQNSSDREALLDELVTVIRDALEAVKEVKKNEWKKIILYSYAFMLPPEKDRRLTASYLEKIARLIREGGRKGEQEGINALLLILDHVPRIILGSFFNELQKIADLVPQLTADRGSSPTKRANPVKLRLEKIRIQYDIENLEKNGFTNVFFDLFNRLNAEFEEDDDEIEIAAMEYEILNKKSLYDPQLRRLREEFPELYAQHSHFFNEALRTRDPEKMLYQRAKMINKFKRDNGFFEEHPESAPEEPVRRAEPKIGRNDPCPCGSGKKYKKCCGAK